MKKEYLITFSSFYKAMYAQEKLQEKGIKTGLKKIPTEILKSCGYALSVKTDSVYNILSILESSMVSSSGVYLVDSSNGKAVYRRVA